jgi:FlaA1/EpsC-like NDP-sugar epimerase
VCERLRVDEIIIAAPSATRQELRAILEKIQATGIKPKILPAVESVLHGKVSLGEVREVAIEDLLGRKEVQLDGHAIAAYVRGKTVLVTGAGGSIGSEICRQVCRFEPKRLILLEQAENPLFFIEGELRRECKGVELVPVVADVCDEVRIDQVFAQHRPDVVLHAAAHKHVPLMEANPGEAVRNNVLGTRNVARSADKHKAAGFVMISTDKAINPTSVMGTTKRLAELYVQAMAAHSATQFISVRFGNVLGSNGSVVPIFREQIRKGGPVTVTHPEMTRYFMTIPEATQLVLQAASTGESGQVFVLDMGEPVRIVDLARDMIRLSGFTPGEDIEIVFSGMRPGEKLFEELSLGSEGISKTKHEKIFIGDVARLPLEVLEREVPRLRGLVEAGEPVAIKAQLKALVPEYAFAPPAPPEEEVEGKVIPFPGA